MQTSSPRLLNTAVIVAALGYFVDIYDLVLFSIVRIPSLKSLGLNAEQITETGILLLDMQMLGMLMGGILWGIMGDKRGRLSVLFGSIFLYSAANIANGFIESIPAYAAWRFIAGIGLAGELGAGITLVAEILPKEKRGIGTMIVAVVGLTGAIVAGFMADFFDWRICYFIGGGLGMLLLVLRIGVNESGMFAHSKAIDMVKTPTITAAVIISVSALQYLNKIVRGIKAPRTKFGTVVVTVARIFVPNCSAAMVTKIIQKPDAKPKNPQRKYSVIAETSLAVK